MSLCCIFFIALVLSSAGSSIFKWDHVLKSGFYRSRLENPSFRTVGLQGTLLAFISTRHVPEIADSFPRLRGGDDGDGWHEDMDSPIYGTNVQQDVSSDNEDSVILTLRRGEYDEKPGLSITEKWIRKIMRQAAIERGVCPNPRYAGLTPEQLRQRELDELLWFHAEEGDVRRVRKVLEQGANVNSRNDQAKNQTAMHHAVQLYSAYVDVLEVLVEYGGDVNAVNWYNNTPMHEAAFWAHRDAVAFLLCHGADCMAVNAMGNTPLLMAEGNWRAVSRPPAMIPPVDPFRPTWEDPEKGGWRHKLKDPDKRLEVPWDPLWTWLAPPAGETWLESTGALIASGTWLHPAGVVEGRCDAERAGGGAAQGRHGQPQLRSRPGPLSGRRPLPEHVGGLERGGGDVQPYGAQPHLALFGAALPKLP